MNIIFHIISWLYEANPLLTS